jgi:hypothetical protein
MTIQVTTTVTAGTTTAIITAKLARQSVFRGGVRRWRWC